MDGRSREHIDSHQCHMLVWLSYWQSDAVLWHSGAALSYRASLSTAGISTISFSSEI